MSRSEDIGEYGDSIRIENGLGHGGEAGGNSSASGHSAERTGDEPGLKREAPRPGSELASYWVSTGERLLVCVTGKTGLEVHDVPADFLGESYRVERAFEDEGALWAMVTDYLAQAKRLDAPPMSPEALATKMLRRDD